MAELLDFIPLDKSWIIRMGILDLINGYDDIVKFLKKQKNLGDDLEALKKVAENWNTDKPLDVGESGTLYRFVRFALWKLGKDREIIKRGTLLNRDIFNNPEIINWNLKKLLTLDGETSQWASASVLMGNKEKIEGPVKLQLSYDAIKHWNKQRENKQCWIPRYDETIEKQAKAFVNILKTNKIEFKAEHSEDYCFARAFELMSKEHGLSVFPQIVNHETNRIEEMEKSLKQAENNDIIDSKDHRVIQAVSMKQMSENKEIKVKHKEAVNKTWPQFWDFLRYAELFRK